MWRRIRSLGIVIQPESGETPFRMPAKPVAPAARSQVRRLIPKTTHDMGIQIVLRTS
jgi:hypothetical protein